MNLVNAEALKAYSTNYGDERCQKDLVKKIRKEIANKGYKAYFFTVNFLSFTHPYSDDLTAKREAVKQLLNPNATPPLSMFNQTREEIKNQLFEQIIAYEQHRSKLYSQGISFSPQVIIRVIESNFICFNLFQKLINFQTINNANRYRKKVKSNISYVFVDFNNTRKNRPKLNVPDSAHIHGIMLVHPDAVGEFENLRKNGFIPILYRREMAKIKSVDFQEISDLEFVVSYSSKFLNSFDGKRINSKADLFEIFSERPNINTKKYKNMSHHIDPQEFAIPGPLF